MSEEGQTEAIADKNKPVDPVRRWTFIVLALCLVLLGWYLRADRVTPSSSQARVNALVVPVAPEVSGTITGVSVRNNQVVEAGQELFQIDIERYQLAVETAEANLAAAQQAVGAAEAAVQAAEASIDSARASMERARQDAVRMRRIREQDPGAISERRLESAEASAAAAQGQLKAAIANRDRALQDLGAEGERNSRILQAQAGLDQARLNLERATVRAPADGVVTGVRLDKGNYAAAGAPQMTFIATHNVWVQADFTENNLGHLDPGNEVAIVFDVLPGKVFKGAVREVGFGVAVDTAPLGSLPTIKNDPNWLRQAQRYPVLIDFELPERDEYRRLKVGSQATVVVYTGSHWLMNPLGALYIRFVSLMTYAY
ncbi:MAG: HlyD family secretion protein [Lysobacterales bacterium]|jgi:multidrug resistance efflux pump